jgi:hypothetical protein
MYLAAVNIKFSAFHDGLHVVGYITTGSCEESANFLFRMRGGGNWNL